ncbi:MAG: 23S rRNA (uracil(1939)-C(5))-methyltransferase RlmD [Verrucomicrobia bacterium]|nr:23S rRNA (uracil(1939)-C(5))-methyltransferase RlmD [Verrucomicrobiota bacterium]
MGRRKKKNEILEHVEIIETAAEGKSLAKVNDQVLFVPHTVPGDIVDVQLYRKRRRYLEGKVIRFHKKSEHRVEPFCEHFGICGGCKWQFISYEDQLRNKQRVVVDALKRIAKVEVPEIPKIIGSKKTTFYRNKLEFTFSNKEWLTEAQIQSEEVFEARNALGFHIPGRFDKVLNIDKCWLQEDPSNAIRNWVKKYAEEHKLSFFDLRMQEGLLRNMIVRTANTGQVMVVFVFHKDEQHVRESFMNDFRTQFPQLHSLMYVINEKRNDSIADLDVLPYHGANWIEETMMDARGEQELTFKVGPKSFYQTNSDQAYELYKVVAEFAKVQATDVVYDFYTGTGTIANFIASKSKKVIGVEYVPEAIEDAKGNSKNNGIQNTDFFAGDLKDVFNTDFIEYHGKADVIITDPPRAGMHKDVVNQMLDIKAERIVYVSCNPATQARDLALLDENYLVSKVQAVDMFPHTHHVESVVLLSLRK